MDLSFPIEFLVHGTAVSFQAKRAESRDEWKQRVKAASVTALPQPHFASEALLSVTLYYLPDEPMQGDIDSIVKPILDAYHGTFTWTIIRLNDSWYRNSNPASPSHTRTQALSSLRPSRARGLSSM